MTPVPFPPTRGVSVSPDEIAADQQQMSLAAKVIVETEAEPEDIAPIQESEWRDTPFVKNQFSDERWRAYCRLGPSQIRHFIIPREIEEFNLFLASIEPPGSPAHKLEKQEPFVHLPDGSYSTLVMFRKVSYRALGIGETKAKPTTKKTP